MCLLQTNNIITLYHSFKHQILLPETQSLPLFINSMHVNLLHPMGEYRLAVVYGHHKLTLTNFASNSTFHQHHLH